ncbi:hypothetical protein GL218_01358 [Daldinia childiae]|uniref:uncharacterized protein n=1 Tax=Daldinia childiae TaxID=326645 RepID=UPI001447DDAE|nr:uncharacterized protein GL218_01358 [Daldinia childiae]KAF3063605.1 hypothetical protein GL218_01358 [Daldinia childiae]
MPSTLLPCLVILETTPLSRHTSDNILDFGRFATDQFEFKLKLIAHPDTYHLIKLNMYRNVEVGNSHGGTTWIAGVDFYLQSMSHVSCTRLSQDATTSYLNRKFNPLDLCEAPLQASSGSLRLSLRCSRALLYYEEARLMGETEKGQIKLLQGFADSVSTNTPREVTFLVGEDRSAAKEKWLQEIAMIEPSKYFADRSSKLSAFKAISLVSGMVSDPLARWFARSPKKELINIRNILEAGEKDASEGTRNVVRPPIPTIGIISRFFDDRQFKITQAYGTIDHITRAQIFSDKRILQEFQCHIIVLPESLDDLDNPSTVAVAVRISPGSNTHLPSSATECEIRVLQVERTKNPLYDVNIAKELPEVLGRIAYENLEEPSAMGPEDFVSYCNVIKDAEQIGAKKAKAIRTELEGILSGFWVSERMVDISVLRKFVAKHKNYLRMPQVKDMTLERKLATWNARATDTVFTLFGSRFRVFLAKIPLEP